MIDPVAARPSARAARAASSPVDNRSMRAFELATAALALVAAALLALAR